MRAPVNTPYTFSAWINNAKAVRVLAFNRLRASLAVENLSETATLYVAFDADAAPSNGLALGPGKGIIWDVICPQSAVSLFMDNATAQQCSIMEIAYASANS